MLCSDIQYNTPHLQINPEIYGLQNIPNFLWGLYDLLEVRASIKVWDLLSVTL